MSLVSSSSLSLFAFANDGTVAWLRESGARLVAVDARSGEVMREVRLDPVPFGIRWRVERQGSFFVVRDDHEIAAYDDATGSRLWKRTSPTDVAFAGERDARHISVLPDAGGEGIAVALADLATGAFDKKLSVEGSMRFVGTHGTLVDDLLFFATDQREVYSVDVARWQVVQRHRVEGVEMLPPVATSSGVYVASVERRETGAVTHVATLDRATGHLVTTQVLPGAAHAISAGRRGIVLESRRTPSGPVERVAFRPDAPHLRLTAAKYVDMQLVRSDVPRLGAGAGPGAAAELAAHAARVVREARSAGRRDEIMPAPRDGSEAGSPTAKDGLLGLLAVLEASSDVLVRLADAFERRSPVLARIQRLGVTLRDPRARWSAGAGRDPSLLDLGENREGDAIATYVYPRGKSGRVPVVHVSSETGEARWLADDFDVWFAGVLHNASSYAPDAVRTVLLELGLTSDFPRPLANAMPPPWFFEAHAGRWTITDAETALAAGDVEGAERMLVAVARSVVGDATRMAGVKDRLASVYSMLGWDHHRATVVETW